MNNKKEILTGIIVGLIANTIGTLLYIVLFSEYNIADTYHAAVEQGHIGSLLALGAILNLFAFFGFLKLRRDGRAKGVLIATIVTAMIILCYKLF